MYSSNEDVGPGGSASPGEKAERQRIYSTFLNRNLGAGDVHIYILTSNGEPLTGISIGDATVAENSLLDRLERLVKKLGNPPGEPVVKPGPQSVPPDAAASSLVLHLSARGETRGTNYRMFPAENWIVLSKREWVRLLPRGEAKINDSFTIENELAAKLLIKFYPQTVEINTGLERSRIDNQRLTVMVTSVFEGVVRARIDGTLRMKHGSLARNEDTFVNAVLTGFLEYDSVTRSIHRLRLVTKKATYGDEEFRGALRSVSQPVR